MWCNEYCPEVSCRGCPKSKIKELHCDRCDIDLDIYYDIDDKCLCLKCAIKHVEKNMDQFEKEYGIFKTEEDIIELLETHYKRIFKTKGEISL